MIYYYCFSGLCTNFNQNIFRKCGQVFCKIGFHNPKWYIFLNFIHSSCRRHSTSRHFFCMGSVVMSQLPEVTMITGDFVPAGTVDCQQPRFCCFICSTTRRRVHKNNVHICRVLIFIVHGLVLSIFIDSSIADRAQLHPEVYGTFRIRRKLS